MEGCRLEKSDDEFRRLCSSLARNKNKRVLGFPRDWNPATVFNSKTGFYFTEIGAWHFIADLFEGGHKFEEIELYDPVGATGLVFKVEIEKRRPHLYIKVQIGRGKIIGRSFHYSTVGKPIYN